MSTNNTTDMPSYLLWLISLCLSSPVVFNAVCTFLVVPYFQRILHASYLQISFAFLGSFVFTALYLGFFACIGTLLECTSKKECFQSLCGERSGSRIISWFVLWVIGSTVFSTSHLWSSQTTTTVDSPEEMLPIIIAILSFGMMKATSYLYEAELLQLVSIKADKAMVADLKFVIGVAIGVGVLWLPFDLLYDIHFIFSVINGIGLILLLLTLLILHCKECTILLKMDSQSSAEGESTPQCTCSLRPWKITTWLLIFVFLLTFIFPGDFYIFLSDWYLWASNPDPLPESGQEFTTYTMNDLRPVISYWAIVIIGLYGIWMIVRLCLRKSSSNEQSSHQSSPLVSFAWLIYLLVFGALTGILFISSIVTLTSGWLLLIFIISGLHLLMQNIFFIIFSDEMEIQQKTFGTDAGVIECMITSLGMIYLFLSPLGSMASSLLLEYLGYPMLFKIYGWLIAASFVLWLIWLCLVCKNTNDNNKNTKKPNENVSKTKPSMKSMTVFKKSIKSV
jgi:hypothetical protein